MELESDRTPNFENKGHFLKDIDTKDCIKDKVTKDAILEIRTKKTIQT